MDREILLGGREASIQIKIFVWSLIYLFEDCETSEVKS